MHNVLSNFNGICSTGEYKRNSSRPIQEQNDYLKRMLEKVLEK
jgi:hypothetical protein